MNHFCEYDTVLTKPQVKQLEAGAWERHRLALGSREKGGQWAPWVQKALSSASGPGQVSSTLGYMWPMVLYTLGQPKVKTQGRGERRVEPENTRRVIITMEAAVTFLNIFEFLMVCRLHLMLVDHLSRSLHPLWEHELWECTRNTGLWAKLVFKLQDPIYTKFHLPC